MKHMTVHTTRLTMKTHSSNWKKESKGNTHKEWKNK